MSPTLAALALALAPVPTAVVDASNDFAADLYGAIGAKAGNVVFSPASISTALAMTYGGARGVTAAQMVKTMHLPGPPFDVHAGYGALLGRLTSTAAGDPELRLANRLFGQKGWAMEAPFVSLAKDKYGAPVDLLDFKAPEAARSTINGWVAGQTNDRIKDLIPAGVLDADTRLVLTNAVFFKGKWANAFDKKATTDQPFFAAKASPKVPTMRSTMTVGYADHADAQVLELPYLGKDPAHAASMILVLPKKKDGLGALGGKRTFELLRSKPSTTKVDVSLPRFKVTQPTDLNEILKGLGMTDAFKAGQADFSGIHKTEKLFISRALHKAFVQVDEEGTEAAAATAIVVATEGAMPHPTPAFQADHPFAWAIRDKSTGALLFVGRVDDPS